MKRKKAERLLRQIAEIRPGDEVIIECASHMTQDQVDYFLSILRRLGAEAAVLSGGLNVSAVVRMAGDSGAS